MIQKIIHGSSKNEVTFQVQHLEGGFPNEEIHGESIHELSTVLDNSDEESIMEMTHVVEESIHEQTQELVSQMRLTMPYHAYHYAQLNNSLLNHNNTRIIVTEPIFDENEMTDDVHMQYSVENESESDLIDIEDSESQFGKTHDVITSFESKDIAESIVSEIPLDSWRMFELSYLSEPETSMQGRHWIIQQWMTALAFWKRTALINAISTWNLYATLRQNADFYQRITTTRIFFRRWKTDTLRNISNSRNLMKFARHRKIKSKRRLLMKWEGKVHILASSSFQPPYWKFRQTEHFFRKWVSLHTKIHLLRRLDYESSQSRKSNILMVHFKLWLTAKEKVIAIREIEKSILIRNIKQLFDGWAFQTCIKRLLFAFTAHRNSKLNQRSLLKWNTKFLKVTASPFKNTVMKKSLTKRFFIKWVSKSQNEIRLNHFESTVSKSRAMSSLRSRFRLWGRITQSILAFRYLENQTQYRKLEMFFAKWKVILYHKKLLFLLHKRINRHTLLNVLIHWTKRMQKKTSAALQNPELKNRRAKLLFSKWFSEYRKRMEIKRLELQCTDLGLFVYLQFKFKLWSKKTKRNILLHYLEHFTHKRKIKSYYIVWKFQAFHKIAIDIHSRQLLSNTCNFWMIIANHNLDTQILARNRYHGIFYFTIETLLVRSFSKWKRLTEETNSRHLRLIFHLDANRFVMIRKFFELWRKKYRTRSAHLMYSRILVQKTIQSLKKFCLNKEILIKSSGIFRTQILLINTIQQWQASYIKRLNMRRKSAIYLAHAQKRKLKQSFRKWLRFSRLQAVGGTQNSRITQEYFRMWIINYKLSVFLAIGEKELVRRIFLEWNKRMIKLTSPPTYSREWKLRRTKYYFKKWRFMHNKLVQLKKTNSKNKESRLQAIRSHFIIWAGRTKKNLTFKAIESEISTQKLKKLFKGWKFHAYLKISNDIHVRQLLGSAYGAWRRQVLNAHQNQALGDERRGGSFYLIAGVLLVRSFSTWHRISNHISSMNSKILDISRVAESNTLRLALKHWIAEYRYNRAASIYCTSLARSTLLSLIKINKWKAKLLDASILYRNQSLLINTIQLWQYAYYQRLSFRKINLLHFKTSEARRLLFAFKAWTRTFKLALTLKSRNIKLSRIVPYYFTKWNNIYMDNHHRNLKTKLYGLKSSVRKLRCSQQLYYFKSILF